MPYNIDKNPFTIKPKLSYLRDWVYGGVDGAVTTFAVVSGVVGAQLSPSIILILGAANLLADGFSMAAGNYLSTKAEEEQHQHYGSYVKQQIENAPALETEAVRSIYQEKGCEGSVLHNIVDLITSDKTLWKKTLLQEKFGLATQIRSPYRAAMSTFTAFLICGLVPLIPYIFNQTHGFLLASFFTGVVFFLIGSLKSRWSLHPWWRSGTSTLFVGAIAASIAYGVGVMFRMYL